ncbi:NIPSNAP family protein [Piscinibacter sakaiensis]|uniref:NIPSNAP family protein n=1 Tax=Piscinibacter sakaiensis TaxID=1547922 RepID=UPI003AAD5702
MAHLHDETRPNGRLRQSLPPLQNRHLGGLIGFYVSEIGAMNQVVHMWRYDNLGDREKRRAALDADPAWAEYRRAFAALDVVIDQQSQILRPTDFSPN